MDNALERRESILHKLYGDTDPYGNPVPFEYEPPHTPPSFWDSPAYNALNTAAQLAETGGMVMQAIAPPAGSVLGAVGRALRAPNALVDYYYRAGRGLTPSGQTGNALDDATFALDDLMAARNTNGLPVPYQIKPVQGTELPPQTRLAETNDMIAEIKALQVLEDLNRANPHTYAVPGRQGFPTVQERNDLLTRYGQNRVVGQGRIPERPVDAVRYQARAEKAVPPSAPPMRQPAARPSPQMTVAMPVADDSTQMAALARSAELARRGQASTQTEINPASLVYGGAAAGGGALAAYIKAAESGLVDVPDWLAPYFHQQPSNLR